MNNRYEEMRKDINGNSTAAITEGVSFKHSFEDSASFQKHVVAMHTALAVAAVRENAAKKSKNKISIELVEASKVRFDQLLDELEGEVSRAVLEGVLTQLSWELAMSHQAALEQDDEFILNVQKEAGDLKRNFKNHNYQTPYRDCLKALADYWSSEGARLLDGFDVKLMKGQVMRVMGGDKNNPNNPKRNTPNSQVSVFEFVAMKSEAAGKEGGKAANNSENPATKQEQPEVRAEALVKFAESLGSREEILKALVGMASTLEAKEALELAKDFQGRMVAREKAECEGVRIEAEILEATNERNEASGKLGQSKVELAEVEKDLAVVRAVVEALTEAGAEIPKAQKAKHTKLEKLHKNTVKAVAGYEASMKASKAKVSELQKRKAEIDQAA